MGLVRSWQHQLHDHAAASRLRQIMITTWVLF